MILEANSRIPKTPTYARHAVADAIDNVACEAADASNAGLHFAIDPVVAWSHDV